MSRGVWIGGLGLGLVAVCFMLWNANDRAPTLVSEPLASEKNAVVSSALTTVRVDTAVLAPPLLPRLDFPPGSVEEACGLNSFPSYHYREDDGDHEPNSPFNGLLDWIPLESEECWTALENHLSTINPYLWGKNTSDSQESDHHGTFVPSLSRQFALVALDHPLTFGRIFADPARDFVRMQEALSRPECLLEPGEKNWELQESCHAEAFLNYALINRFCFGRGVSDRAKTYYRKKDNPTPEQDRLMWKQDLEDAWIEKKCEGLDSMLELTTEQNPELYRSVMSLRVLLSRHTTPSELLIDLAARLGDNAAGLTFPVVRPGHPYNEEGYKYGRFAELLSSEIWIDFAVKKAPSTERFLQTFNMLARVTSRKPDPRDEFKLNWEWVARYLCEPPYYTTNSVKFFSIVPVENVEHPSCKEIVHEIRQGGTTFRPLLDVLDKFEQVALELEVYE